MTIAERVRRHPWTILTVSAAVGGVATAWYMQGNMREFFHFVSAASVFVLFGLIAAAGLLAALVARATHGGWRRPLNAVTRFSLAVACASFLSVYCGFAFHKGLVVSAKSWSEEQVSRIERYREVHGAFPSELKEVVDVADAPRLVRNGDLQYVADIREFRFDLHTGLISGWCWNSDERTWHYYD